MPEPTVTGLLDFLRERGGSVHLEYSRYNERALRVVEEAERQGLVTTEVVNHHEAQFSSLKVTLNDQETNALPGRDESGAG